MGRARRVDVGGIVYHAWNRASFRAALFQREAHYQDFVSAMTLHPFFWKGFPTPFPPDTLSSRHSRLFDILQRRSDCAFLSGQYPDLLSRIFPALR